MTLGRLLDDYAKALPRRPKMHGAGLPSPACVAIGVAQAKLAVGAIDRENMAVASVTSVDVRRMLNPDVGSITNARARFGALSRFMDWCQDAGHIDLNPCALIGRAPRPRPPLARAHYLAPSDLARLWHAAEALTVPDYLTVVDQGADALLRFDPAGHGGGSTVVVLQGLGSTVT